MANTQSGQDLLKSLRDKLVQFNKATPSQKPLLSSGSLLGAYATVWILKKLLLDHARQESQTGFDKLWPTGGANLNILDL